MTDLASWALTDFSDGGRTFPVYRKGSGPGVVIVHEIPGITPAVLAFAAEVVAAGFTVVLPSLFGEPGAPVTVTMNFRPLPVSASGASSPSSASSRPRRSPTGCVPWPGRCTPNWAARESGRSACVSPAVSRSR